LLMIISLFLLSPLNYALGKRNLDLPHYRLQYDELINSNSDNEYVILGGSKATHGIRPSYLKLPGMSGYNFALNGANPEFYFNWYRELFRKTYQRPKYIIFSVSFFLFDEHWLWRRYEQDSEYFPIYIFLNNLVNLKGFDTEMLLMNRFPFTKYKKINDLVHLFSNQRDKSMPVNEYDRGFIPYEAHDPNSINDRSEIISHNQIIYFEKLIDLINKDGIKLIFVNLPEYGLISNYTNLESSSIFNKIASKYSIPTLNYNVDKRSNINEERKYYSNWVHLNTKGSMEFSKVLSRDLRNIIDREIMQR